MKAGLGLPDLDAWYMIETIAEKNNIGYTQFVSKFLVPVGFYSSYNSIFVFYFILLPLPLL